jgi:diguanylate cyclase (GGDEF)-like protein
LAKLASSFLVKHLQKINRLRWFFIGVFVLIVWLVSQEISQILSLIIPTGMVILSMLVFDWFYNRLEQEQSNISSNRAVEWLVFWQVLIDIAFITFGIGLTGGPLSLLPLVYVIYFGALEIFFRPGTLLVLNGVAILSYVGLVQAYTWGLVPASFLKFSMGWYLANQPNRDFLFFVLLVLILNAILVVLRSSQLDQHWLDTENDNAFLNRLNLLSQTAIADVNDKSAFSNLSNEIKKLLGANNIYITRWDEESELVLSLAADSSVHTTYMKMPATPRYENTFTRSTKRIGKPVIAENVFCTPYISPRVAVHFPARSVLAAPMYGEPENRFLGALLVCFNTPHYFSSREITRIKQVTDILSLLISRTWLYDDAMHRAELLEKMAGQVTNLVSDLKRTTLLPSIVESARSLLQAQRAALHLQQKNGEMKCEYSVGLSDTFLEQLTRRFNQLAGGKLLQNRDFVVIPDVNQDSRTSPVQDLIFGEKFRAYAVFSLNPEHEEKGAISLYWDQPYVVSADEISVGKLFAERASAIIRSAHIYARATEDALTDILTELPNRRHLDQRIKDEIERASRYEHTFALLMIDLDGFKGINDTFGHPIGDSVLKQVSASLRRTLRASDFLARYGGDEFSIILPETGLERALLVAEKLRLSLTSTRLHLPQETQRYLSGCMGIAIYPSDRRAAEDLLLCSDQRLYRAKRSGSGSIIYKDD